MGGDAALTMDTWKCAPSFHESAFAGSLHASFVTIDRLPNAPVVDAEEDPVSAGDRASVHTFTIISQVARIGKQRSAA